MASPANMRLALQPNNSWQSCPVPSSKLKSECACNNSLNSSGNLNKTLILNGYENPDGDLPSPDDNSENSNSQGSDASRNSTGSRRSQDSGFSDSGSRRKKNGTVIENVSISSPSHSFAYARNPVPQEYCQRRLTSAPISDENYTHHRQHRNIYESVQGSWMPSPILPNGFGNSDITGHNHHHPIHIDTPPKRQMETATLPRNFYRKQFVPSRTSTLPSSCPGCLPPSIFIREAEMIQQQPRTITPRRLFPPQKMNHFSSYSHDISALAYNAAATAIGPLQVPILSSTPKRHGICQSQSTSKLPNGYNMVKIDNFSRLNKNINRDNNNNSSSGKGRSAKTFTIQKFGSSTEASSLGQEELDEQQESVTPASKHGRRRTAAESIYEKICNRLSSFSSPSSGGTPQPDVEERSAVEKSEIPFIDEGNTFISSQISNACALENVRQVEKSGESVSKVLKERKSVQSQTCAPVRNKVEVTSDNKVVMLWLKELKFQSEMECIHTLQTKSILPEKEFSEEDNWSTSSSFTRLPQSSLETVNGQKNFVKSTAEKIHAVSQPLISIRNVEVTANIISGEFSRICKHLEFANFTQVPSLVFILARSINDFLRSSPTPMPGPRGAFHIHLEKVENRLETACYALDMSAKVMNEAIITSDGYDKEYQDFVRDVVEGIVTVGNLFSQTVDLRLTRDLASLLDTIGGGGIPARIALKSLSTVLADGGNHICRLAADIRTVRGLLGVLLDIREDQDKILALRCLATVLCVGEAVRDFDKAGGFEIIADIVFDPGYSKWIKIEAVAALTQATDPWIDLETTLTTLGVHLEKLVFSLTNLIRECKTEEESFLLLVAAVSNLTFLELGSTEYLQRCRTVPHLISAVKENPSFSVFVLDHIATILANMAGIEFCRHEIIQCGGIDALLRFLQQIPNPTGKADASAITACERLQQKSIIAISRLANEEGVAPYIFNMGGVHRLITLCRKEKERNYSDGVLIAALATLRKLITICGDEAIQRLKGAEDLIEPRLLDSFLLYSSRQESYV